LDSLEQNNPLVSIIVITYNSSKYVLETLESVKAQTYQNIELIISDDASHDDTVEICKNWLEENRKRFIRTELITVEKNTGIPANCNRGVKISKGEWVKLIAGDDILIYDCVFNLITFSTENFNAHIIFGRTKILKNNILSGDQLLSIYGMKQKEQYEKILKGSGIPSAAAFIKKTILIDFGGFDEKYKFIEDGPFWIKLSESGIYFYFLNKEVVIYRIHDSNTSRVDNQGDLIRINFYTTQRAIFINEVIPRLKKKHMCFQVFLIYNRIFVSNAIIKLGNKKNVYTTMICFMDVSRILSFIKNRILNF
jgi:glycosyltransferase involved in cell wall biosynthesis